MRTWALALCLLIAAAACAPRSKGTNPKLGLAQSGAGPAGTSNTPTGPRVDPGAFARNNGEGYSGPDFVFDLIPDPAQDNRIGIQAISLSFDSCLRAGSFGERSKSGLLPAGTRLLGQIYGVTTDPTLRERAMAAFREGTIYSPFPKVQYGMEPAGIRGPPDFKIEVGDVRNPFVMSYLSPENGRLETLRSRADLPFFIASLNGWRFTAGGRRFEPWISGRLFAFAGGVPNRSEALLFADGRASPYILNTQDIYECMIGHSQLLAAEKGVVGSLRDDIAREDHLPWFLRTYSGTYESEYGRLLIARDGTLEFEGELRSHGGFSCRSHLRGRVRKAERHFKTLELDQSLSGSLWTGTELQLSLEFDKKVHDGRLLPLASPDINPEACEARAAAPVVVSQSSWSVVSSTGPLPHASSQALADRAPVLTTFWPVARLETDGIAIGHTETVIKWRKTDGLVSVPFLPARPGANASCAIFEPWTRHRWNARLPETRSLADRVALYQREYEARRRVSRDLFQLYWREGRLDASLFENCLHLNGERQNFLHTLSAVFWEETVVKLKEIQARSGSRALEALLQRYEASKGRRAPPLFRMTGHSGSRSDNERKGGVLQGAPALFLNAFSLSRDEWLMIWVHEVSHYLDRDLETAVVAADEIADVVRSTPPADLQPEIADRWVRYGIERTYAAETRAWIETFRVYLENKDVLAASIPWLETALSFRGKGEPVDRYTRRLLKELNHRELANRGFLSRPELRKRAQRILSEAIDTP